MKDFFDSIKTELESKISTLKTVELWNNQIEAGLSGDQVPIVTPAVFMSIDGSIEWSDLTGSKAQVGAFTFRVYIVNDNLVDNIRGDQGTDWKFMDLKQDVFKVLHGFLPTGARDSIRRISEDLDEDHGGKYNYVQDYSATYTDCDAVPELIPVDATLNVSTKLVIQNSWIRTSKTFEDIPDDEEESTAFDIGFEGGFC